MAIHRILQDLLLCDFSIPDPGAGGTIRLDRDRGVMLFDATGGARTLADPPRPGVRLTMYQQSGLDTTVTADTSIDKVGGTVITFGNDDDWIELMGVEAESTLKWVVVAGNGPDELMDSEADDIEIVDSGSLIAASTVEDALQELAQHNQSAQRFLNIPMGAWTLNNGAALAVHSAAPTPGYHATAEGMGIQWAAHATPTPIGTVVPYPPDLDPASDVVVHILAAKTGATLGDAVTWTIEAFENINAALYDADSDFGGASSAMTGDAAAKTCQEETLTLAAANITGSPGCLNLTMQPTDGTLGTDDVIVFGVWLEYTGRTLTT